MENEEDRSQMDDDWGNRKLCSDPACIGVIGPDGRCKECGRPYEGEAFEDSPFSESASESGSETDDITEDPAAAYEEAEADDDEESATDEEWAKRKLCSDPACIGVIGPDGRCKECGKPDKGK